jgi:hypothetical protein
MISFKKFINRAFNKTENKYIILNEPIHFKKHQMKIKEINESISNSKILNDLKYKNLEKYGGRERLSEILHNSTAKNLNKDEIKHIHYFTSDISHFNKTYRNGSTRLNYSLINGTALHDHDQKIHDTIMKHAKPSGHSFHLFSGDKRDFKKISKRSGSNIFYCPAHTSATHAIEVAHGFAHEKRDEKNNMHFIHIHVNPHDKILHVSHYSENPDEHETIIPAGTTLKYHGTTVEKNEMNTYHIHHMTIHSQK